MSTNMRVLKPSRSNPKPGDVFALQLQDFYLFGRVISTEAKAGWSMPGAFLIYVFNFKSNSLDLPNRSELKPTKLLLPPIMTNKLPWSRGYFQTISNLPLDDDEVLQRHCFRSVTGNYFDEFAKELPGPSEPCGEWGLHSFLTIDDAVSNALGVPVAPQ